MSAVSDAFAAVDVVIAVATEKVRHGYQGLCPDVIEGPDSRDPSCKACNLLVDAAATAAQFATPAPPKGEPT